MVIAIATVVFILDQWTKAWITEWLGPGSDRHRFEVVGSLFSLRYARNSGAAFGLLDDQGTLLAVIAAGVIGALLVLAYRRALRSTWQHVTVGLIVGGAAGNLVDRLRHGFVTDFIDIGRWPTFNVADSAITVGIVLMILRGMAPASRSEGASDRDLAR